MRCQYVVLWLLPYEIPGVRKRGPIITEGCVSVPHRLELHLVASSTLLALFVRVSRGLGAYNGTLSSRRTEVTYHTLLLKIDNAQTMLYPVLCSPDQAGTDALWRLRSSVLPILSHPLSYRPT